MRDEINSGSTISEYEAPEYPTYIKLFDRSSELRILIDKFNHVKKSNTFEKVVIHGRSGSGKTSLVLALQNQVISENGFFCTGNYFQNSSEVGQEPYSAIMAAFSDLCDLMLQSENFNEQKRSAIKEELETDGELLMSWITNISPFLDIKSNEVETSSDFMNQSTFFARFNLACKHFLLAMSSKTNPVVIFLDDIQWMDSSSHALLESLIPSKQLKNIMLILTYRDEEPFFAQGLTTNQIGHTTDIALNGLNQESVVEMVTEVLGASQENTLQTSQENMLQDIHDLGVLISNRTQGNPYHVLHFVEMIKRDGLIMFDSQLSLWHYDVNAIQEKVMISDSVADLILRKLECLDEETRKLMNLASLLGYHLYGDEIMDFAPSILFKEEKSEETRTSRVRAALQKAVDMRFIEELYDGYQFTHDKIQAAFRESMDEDERQYLHYGIGYGFLSKSDDVSKYMAAVHLNIAPNYIVGSTEMNALMARTNLQASKYCQQKSSLVDAAAFLRRGLSYLDPDEKSLVHSDLRFELYKSLAKLDCVLGNVEECIAANQYVLTWARSNSDIIKALSIEINIRIAANAYEGVVMVTKKIYHQLGIRGPKIITPFHLFAKIKKLRKCLDSKTDEECLSLPHATVDSSEAIRLLLRVTFYLNQKKKTLWMIYTVLLATEYSLMHGLSPRTASCLTSWGIVESILGSKDRAYRLGTLSIKLGSMTPTADYCMLISWSKLFLLFLKERVWGDSIPFSLRALNTCLESGDLISADFCNVGSFYLRLWSGEHLDSLESSMRIVYSRFDELGQEKLLETFKPMLQMVLNFKSTCENTTILTGEIMNESECLRSISSVAPPVYRNRIFICKMFLAYSFGCYKLAEDSYASINPTFFENISIVSIPLNFYCAMIYYARYISTGYRKYLRKARKARKFVKRHSTTGNPNVAPYLRLLQAERISISCHNAQSADRIMESFNHAIDVQAREGFAHLEGLANERAGMALARLGCLRDSLTYLEQANDVYQEKWGAPSKGEWMDSKISSCGSSITLS